MKNFEQINTVLELLIASYIHKLQYADEDSECECENIKNLAVLLEKESAESETVLGRIKEAETAFETTGFSYKKPTQYELGRLLNCIMILSAEVTELNYKEFVETVRTMIGVIQLWNPGYELKNYTEPYDDI